jgi:DNA invertase Pin-like site-specific DNA recombinase
LIHMTKSRPIRPQFVAYYRVSTDKQGRSGLGLAAQTATVEAHAGRSSGPIIATFQEVESGKRNDRPELLKALALCRQKKAVLVIAKLDRLSRNVAFIANLMESRVEFIACDMPEATPLTLHIMAAMAQQEREATSKRTKEALAAAKARGQKLGSPRPGSKQGNQAWAAHARQFREGVYPIALRLKDRGLTLRQVAEELNERHIRTCNNRVWHAATVGRLLQDAV